MNSFITPFYAATLGLMFSVLSIRVLRLRIRLKIPLGNGDNQALLRAIRVQANFAEYTPLTLLLIYMLEWGGVHVFLVNLFNLSLLLGRISHAFGVSKLAEDIRYRVFGMAMTLFALIGSAVCLLVIGAWGGLSE